MEVAAAAVVAEQAITTPAEAAVAYGVMRPTPAHTATYTRIPSSTSLPRIHHSIVVINEHAYVFGGEDDKGELAGDSVEIIKLSDLGIEKAGEHGSLKAVSDSSNKATPQKRKGHTAVAVEGKMFVYGGSGADGKPIEEHGRVWIFDPATTTWSHLDPGSGSEVPPSRTQHAAIGTSDPQPGSNLSIQDMLPSGSLSPVEQTSKVESTRYSGTLIIHGGASTHDTWSLDLYSQIWRPLPSPPASTSSLPPTLALANSTLYTLHPSSPFAHDIHALQLKSQAGKLLPSQDAWTTTTIPTNPLTPGPAARTGAPLLPITTGAGRLYLLYLMGERLPSPTPDPQAPTPSDKEGVSNTNDTSTQEDQPSLLSDAHLYGLPLPLTTAAGIKDSIRSTLRLETPVQGWEEVGVGAEVPDSAQGEGKAHPGPRAWMAADTLDGTASWGGVGKGEVGLEQGRGVVVWGGRNARGEVEGDGWVVRIGS